MKDVLLSLIAWPDMRPLVHPHNAGPVLSFVLLFGIVGAFIAIVLISTAKP